MSIDRSSKSRREIENELVLTGLPYQIERGRKHLKILLAGRFIGVMSHKSDCGPIGIQNIICLIRREARKLKQAQT